MNLGILEGRAAGYSQGLVGAMYRNPDETGIPMAVLGLFPRDRSRIAPPSETAPAGVPKSVDIRDSPDRGPNCLAPGSIVTVSMVWLAEELGVRKR